MKRIFAIILAAALLLSFAACDLNVDHKAKIVGTWICRVEDTEENRAALMEAIELYDEEIALVNAKLYTSKALTFCEDGTYSFSEDGEGLQQYVLTFFKEAFADLYAGRSQIATLYEDVDLSTLTEEEFYQFYAELYNYDDFDTFVTELAASVYDYDELEAYETGTYTVGSERIIFDAEDDENDGGVSYSVVDDTLAIQYADETERYTKAD